MNAPPNTFTDRAVLALGAELLLQVNATLAELVRQPGITVAPTTVRLLDDTLEAALRLCASTHYSSSAEAALKMEGGNPRVSEARRLLPSAHHSLRILQSLYGDKAAS